MEDMARLAVFESNIGDFETFSNVLGKLLGHIRCILENPEDPNIRRITAEPLKKSLNVGGFTEYLKYLGFEIRDDCVAYPKELSLNKLKMAEAAIERKLKFSGGPSTSSCDMNSVLYKSHIHAKPRPLLPKVHLKKRGNQYLETLESLFNDILKHEDDELQRLAREHIPLVTLQTKALERMRLHQKLIKTGETKQPDLPFDTALLMELLGWFKYSFFSWVDKPPCNSCGGDTAFIETGQMATGTGSQSIKLELYKCVTCGSRAQFPRYRDGRSLLRERRGRCGEWADCFTLMCRSLGFETRHVHDTTDHVWCEVFDYDRNEWLHVDPCEAKLDAPLIYENGWGKKLQYVIAVSKDDIQDVTWRYTSNHKAILARRNLCSEQELIETIQSFRGQRQTHLSETRRLYLAQRCLRELVQLMIEKQPSDFEGHGRISGSKEWRTERGEIGLKNHVIEINQPGKYNIKYYPGIDKYKVIKDDKELNVIVSWAKGVFKSKNIFRKVEYDWKMVYLAREEGEDIGTISWRVAAVSGITLSSLCVNATTKLYENGKIDWNLTFDVEKPVSFKSDEPREHSNKSFKELVITAELSGGAGDVAWQHAQLFRRHIEDPEDAFNISFEASKSI